MSLLSQPATLPSAPPREPLDIIIIGLTITSSWGNGHATTYRGLVRELTRRGHDVLFLEHDKPWYAANRDLPEPPYGTTRLYQSVDELIDRYSERIRWADLVIVGSYVPDGVAVGRCVTDTARGITAFYDIDTPVTLAKLARGDLEYLAPDLIPRYGLYLSFTGGPTLHRLENEFVRQARCASVLFGRPGALCDRASAAPVGPGLSRHPQRRSPAIPGSAFVARG